MFEKSILFGCLMTAALAMIAVEPGYDFVTQKFPEYVSRPSSEVVSELEERFPNLKAKLFDEDNLNRQLEEFFFGRIKVVTNNDGIVVEPPVYAGTEPNLSFMTNLLGKEWTDVVSGIQKHLPEISIIVKQGDTILSSVVRSTRDYLLVRVDENFEVSKMPVYVRSPPPKTGN